MRVIRSVFDSVTRWGFAVVLVVLASTAPVAAQDTRIVEDATGIVIDVHSCAMTVTPIACDCHVSVCRRVLFFIHFAPLP